MTVLGGSALREPDQRGHDVQGPVPERPRDSTEVAVGIADRSAGIIGLGVGEHQANGAKPVAVSTAEVIANPGSTVLQGTLIAASLETALESSLPGQITAVVNRPVWSFDQSRVLIPQGSRLFGAYDSDVSLGQARVLVGWTRLVTPDGQSVQLAAFGADAQGRSGVTGDVNSRFGLRFGSAALLSIIGAAREIAIGISGNFADTTNVVVGQYASLPPVISVQAGAAITVIVDRDLEFH